MRRLIACLATGVLVSQPAIGMDPDATPDNPLAVFAPFIGTWAASDGTRQTFAWGFDRRVVHTTLTFSGPDGPTAASEGAYYWDPEIRSIRGFAVTAHMPVSHFNIIGGAGDAPGTLEWQNLAFTPEGAAIPSVEVWRLEDDGTFGYQVFKLEDSARIPWLTGTWTRAASGSTE